MATISTSQSPESILAAEFKGLCHRRFYVTDIDNAEGITPGPDHIKYAAFEPDAGTDHVNVTILTPSLLLFSVGSGSAHSGHVHTWSAD